MHCSKAICGLSLGQLAFSSTAAKMQHNRFSRVGLPSDPSRQQRLVTHGSTQQNTTIRTSDAMNPSDRSRDAGKTAVLRILDAQANRAAEGLRVIEDYVRFVLDDRHLSQLAKSLRHDL